VREKRVFWKTVFTARWWGGVSVTSAPPIRMRPDDGPFEAGPEVADGGFAAAEGPRKVKKTRRD
jgi:hypothetical protein